MSSVRLRGWPAVLTAAAVALLPALVAAPAAHAEGGPALTLVANHSEVGLPQPAVRGDSSQIGWGMEGEAGGSTATDVVVKVDVSGISGFADVTGLSCVDDICSWPSRDIAPGTSTGGIVDVNAKPGAALGTTGTARLFATSSNATVAETSVKLTVGAVDLGIARIPDTTDAAPGSTLAAPITVSNSGSLTADAVTLSLAATPGLGFAEKFANCTYGKSTTIPSAHGHSLDTAVCRIATPVEPGKAYRLSSQVGIEVEPTALYEFVDYGIEAVSSSVPKAAAADGPVLRLVESGTPPVVRTDHAQWRIDADNTADIELTGSTANAVPGDEAVLTAKVRNNGPATFNLLNSDAQIGVLVEIPKGTTAVKIPSECGVWTGAAMGEPTPGADEYMCEVESPFTVGETLELPFTVMVEQGAPATTSGDATVKTVWGGALDADADKANNTAKITLKTTASTATPGSTGPSSDANAAGTGAPAASDTPAAAASGTPNASGTMASTGSGSTPAIAAAGALALIAGGAIALVARRRKARTGEAA
ncbi:LPXTG cell wall anchor domain-containing protein [Streptomyces sp. NBC_00102]|uniref:LPXTG cell wall anchor domain-containing protein n=1 Tax=Streptomyces sp. NBC_00102 TaxID=2975652 RepID=UPI00224DC567|nr:LPXTG cell wall anchor domain-containing protein [Streptomyces sp. NBC_00102]MCX5401560.1 LPXTG cell wall anchor domain-containing protein [Streptomyces sp. NBC_00102]